MQVSKWIIAALVAVALLAASSAIWGWYHPKVHTETVYQPVEVPKEVERIKRVYIPAPKGVQALEKGPAVKELGLPPAIANNPDIQVVAAGKLDCPPGGKAGAVAFFNAPDGRVDIISRPEPPAFFAFENDKEIGVRYGLTTAEAGRQIDIYARWTFVRVGALHLAAYGEINDQSEGKAMLELSYRW